MLKIFFAVFTTTTAVVFQRKQMFILFWFKLAMPAFLLQYWNLR